MLSLTERIYYKPMHHAAWGKGCLVPLLPIQFSNYFRIPSGVFMKLKLSKNYLTLKIFEISTFFMIST